MFDTNTIYPLLDFYFLDSEVINTFFNYYSGINTVFEEHDMRALFVTCQVADDHPSKPHPSMIETALAETGVEPENAVMIGDTRFDMDMARAANVAFIGVDWGYHPGHSLTHSVSVISHFDQLHPMLNKIWSEAG